MVGLKPHARAADRLLELPILLASDTGFEECVRSLYNRDGATFDSVWGSSCALLAAALKTEFDNVLIVCPDHKIQDNVIDDLETFHRRRAFRFPAHMVGPDARVTIDFENGERLRILKQCIDGKPPELVVATAGSLIQPVPNHRSITENTRKIARGQRIDLPAFQQWLIQHGFHQTTAVELPGEFSARGGIVDVFAPDWFAPVRIELFDDEVESLRYFRVDSQRSENEIEQIEITLFSTLTRSEGHFSNFLPEDTLVLLVEQEEIEAKVKSLLSRITDPQQFFSWNQVQQQFGRVMVGTISRLATGHLGARWQLPIESVEKFSGDIGEIRGQVDRTAGTGEIHVVARTDGEVQRVNEILSTSVSAQGDRLHISEGCVHEGFRIRSLNKVIVGADQLFHRSDSAPHPAASPTGKSD